MFLKLQENNVVKSYYSTVVPLNLRYSFVVGGCSSFTNPGTELNSKNLVLYDYFMQKSFNKNLTIPVSKPACSIYGNRLLFIAGG